MKSTRAIARRRFLWVLALLTATLVSRAVAFAQVNPPTTLVAAVLPSSRSVQVGTLVSAFATIINVGQQLATDCGISLLSSIPAILGYIDLENPWEGGPIDIPAGAAHRFALILDSYGQTAPTDLQLRFKCANTEPAPVIPGLNTLLFSASTTPVADIVALAKTINNDGIVNIPALNGTGAFAVAAVNVGTGDSITVSADTGGVVLPINIFICQTDPKTAACLSSPESSVTTMIPSNDTPTFGLFVAGAGVVPFVPETNRIFVRFNDSSAVTRGSTSVAVRTLGTPDPCPPDACRGPWDY
jgi:hypothetical protein